MVKIVWRKSKELYNMGNSILDKVEDIYQLNWCYLKDTNNAAYEEQGKEHSRKGGGPQMQRQELEKGWAQG